MSEDINFHAPRPIPFWHTDHLCTDQVLLRAARYLAFGSAVAVLFSIAVCQILLGLALLALALSRTPVRVPRITLPLGLFLLSTLVSLAFSGDIAAGMPQVKKIYVYTMLPVVF